jgi:hypothetical protein
LALLVIFVAIFCIFLRTLGLSTMTLQSLDQDDAPRDPSMLSSIKEEPTISPVPEGAPTQRTVSAAPTPPEGKSDEPERKKGRGRKINPKFKDLQETGRWGEISKREKIIIAIFVLLIAGGVAAGVWYFITRDDDEEPVPSSPSTVESPDNLGQYSELYYVFQAINSSDLTYLYQGEMPLAVADYEGLMDNSTATPQERAMSWLLFEDTRNIKSEVGLRWALASLYFTWQGENWGSAKNWLSAEHICEWEHISCNIQTGGIQEIDLQSNNLVGTIPPELALLNTTQALWLRDNQLRGDLPNEVFGGMPRLSILYLDSNQLTGNISLAIRGNQLLSKCGGGCTSSTCSVEHTLTLWRQVLSFCSRTI